MIISLGYATYTILGFFGIELMFIGNIIHLSLIPWLFIYLVSFVLGFCTYHRLPLYYIVIDDVLLLWDHYYTIPLPTLVLFIIHIVLIVIVLTIIYISYVENNKKIIARNNRQH